MATPTNTFQAQVGPIPLAQLDQNFIDVSTFQNPAVGSVVRTVVSKQSDIVSVLDFGASPLGAIDAVTAFTAAQLAGGGVAFLPAGTYLLATSPPGFYFSTGNVTLTGAGAAGTNLLDFSFVPATNKNNVFTKAQRGAPVALTSSGASIAVNMNLANNFLHLFTENTTLAAPSNPVAGQAGVFVFTQPGAAPKTLGFNAFWKFGGGIVPTATATINAVDTLSYYVESAARASCTMLNDVK